jgi:hypothetical protein
MLFNSFVTLLGISSLRQQFQNIEMWNVFEFLIS